MNKTFTEWIRFYMENPYPNFDYDKYTNKDRVKLLVSKVMPPITNVISGTIKEYKLWYIHNQLQFIEAVDTATSKHSYYSPDWVRLPFRTQKYSLPIELAKPTNLQQIIDKGKLLSNLCGDIPFVRITIYNRYVKTCCTTINTLYFGEYDFTPENGLNPFIPEEYEIIYGNQLEPQPILSKSLINKVSNMELSIVIPYHNEGMEFIMTTINSIRETIDVEPYEIIVVDDCSDILLSPIENVVVLRHNKNLGVGQAFDTGVKVAQSENIFLMGSDIRFAPNQWASQMVAEIQANPKSFTCTSCVALNAEELDIEKRRKVNVLNGATILMFHDQKSNPVKNEAYRSIIEAKWLPHLKNRDVDSYEIPCILGAAYGVSKTWYTYIDGWALHMKWGTLEPYISLKSWFFGGSCRMSPRIETGHIFKKVGTHGTPQDALFYNKMMVATMLLEDYQRIISFLPNNSIIKRSRIMYNERLPQIMAKRNEYKRKIVLKQQEYFDRFEIDYRPEFKG